jgi:hypothetical protein
MEYKNAYKGQTCYIFGNGPSIKFMKLADFSDKIGLAANWLVYHKDFNKLNVKFVIDIDPFALSPIFNTLIKKKNSRFEKASDIRKFNKYFMNNIAMNKSTLVTNISNILIKYYKINNKKRIIFVNDGYPFKFYNKHKIIDEINKRFHYVDGSLRFQIYLAIYLGFENAILVGHDYVSNKIYAGHWYEKGLVYQKGDILSWNKGFINEVSKFINLKFITLNESLLTDDKLILYPIESQQYKENSELLEKESLKYLSLITSYKIN